MFSLTNAPTHLFLIPSVFPRAFFDGNLRNKKERFLSLHFVAARGVGSFDLKNRNNRDICWSCVGFVRRCKKGWESDENLALEADILEFMKHSANPRAFPSKKELIDAGRMDLVEAILEQGGWLASGWDLDDDANEVVGAPYNDGIDLSFMKDGEWKDTVIEQRSPEAFSFDFGSCPAASSSGRSLEASANEDSGIEGILSRLERERNNRFSNGLRDREISHVQSNDLRRDWLTNSSSSLTVVDLERNADPINGKVKDKLSHGSSPHNIDGSLKPNTWTMWSAESTVFSEINVEADEIFSNGPIARHITRRGKQDLGDEILERKGDYSVSLNRRKENSSHETINRIQIQRRLKHLESELSSMLGKLKSKADENMSKEVEENSSDLLMLSDAWEFQENEIMNAQHKLRSVRAKLAVLEGKMALAIIDAQKTIEEKQKRIDNARRALQLLRTACIVWPNSASEVLLAGSFDGWASKRKMQKSSSGIFSVCMKLYPGRYEMKFIVDGEWRIDPLRPVVQNGVFENNLLIIT